MAKASASTGLLLLDELDIDHLPYHVPVWQLGLYALSSSRTGGQFPQRRRATNTSKLTPQDVERREKRRERNRLAAQRSRERGKRKMDELMHEIDGLQSKNAELEHMFDGLSKERDRLKRALLDHLSLCPSYEEPLNLSMKNS